MGLCKCPKRRVTNQFCFEHRVNVCEHCMVTNHPKCIVQSYLQWLQDSDYNPICELCTKELANEDCIRLICYHVYHWACLDQHARQLPPTTAPPGYGCPSCKIGLFPATNLVSPVADVLRQKLAGVNWARAGLGLPLLSEDTEQKPFNGGRKQGPDNTTLDRNTHVDAQNSLPHNVSGHRQNTPKRASSSYESTSNDPNPQSVVNVEDSSGSFTHNDAFPVSTGQQPRRVFQAVDEDTKDLSFDHDENKYKRRSAVAWLIRWWKSVSSPASRRHSSGHLYRRYWMCAILILVGLFTVIAVFSWLGRIATDGDPNLDMHNNPHIKIQVDRD